MSLILVGEYTSVEIMRKGASAHRWQEKEKMLNYLEIKLVEENN